MRTGVEPERSLIRLAIVALIVVPWNSRAQDASKARPAPAAAPPAGENAKIAWGEPVKGLRLGVQPEMDIPPAHPPGRPDRQYRPVMQATVTLQNVGDKPQLVLPLLVRGATVHFEVTDADGKPVPMQVAQPDWDVPDYDKAVKTLAPRESVSARLFVGPMPDSRPGGYKVTAKYTWTNAKPPPGRKPEVWNREPIWTGELRSGTATVTTERLTRQPETRVVP